MSDSEEYESSEEESEEEEVKEPVPQKSVEKPPSQTPTRTKVRDPRVLKLIEELKKKVKPGGPTLEELVADLRIHFTF